MKNNKILKSIITFIFVFALILGNFSNYYVKGQTETEVVIHKMKLEDLTSWPKPKNPDGTYPGEGANSKYDGSEIPREKLTEYFGNNSEELAGVKFTYFNVTKEEYEHMNAHKDDFKTKEQVRGYVQVDSFKTTDPTEVSLTRTGVSVTLENGSYRDPKYYWFVEEFGSNIGTGETLSDYRAVPFGLALPMYKPNGNLFGRGSDALHVYPKNTVTKPEIDKNFAGKVENYDNYASNKETISKTIGSKIPYQVKTKLPTKAKYKALRWEDLMDKGLTYNNDLSVKITKKNGNSDESGEFTEGEGNDYTLTHNKSGFVLTFTENGLNKMVNKLDESDYEIELTYSATLNSDAVVNIEMENRIKFEYGNDPKDFFDPRDGSNNPKDNRISIEKRWVNIGQPEAMGTEVTYFLYEKGDNPDGSEDKLVATHKVENNEYNHTFEGLEDGKEYYVREFVQGYNPAYEALEEGKIRIDNTYDPDSPAPLIPKSPKVVTYGKRFVKTNYHSADGATPLFGAQFIVINDKTNDSNRGKYLALKDNSTVEKDKKTYEDAQSEYERAIEEYNKLSAEKQTSTEREKVEAKKVARDAAFNKIRVDYEWTDSKEKAIKFSSNSKGQFEVTGLEEGDYSLKEVVAPLGYALLDDEVSFHVDEYSYKSRGNINYEVAGDTTVNGDSATQILNKSLTIPQTGGMGTILFTVVGVLIMGTSLVAMRRRKAEE